MDDKEFWQRAFLARWSTQGDDNPETADKALELMKSRWPSQEPKDRGKGPKSPPATDFEAFWRAYPDRRRVGKGDALKAWNSKNPPIQACLDTLSWQRRSEDWKKDEGKWIPHPATWLNGSRWLDERPGGQTAGGVDPEVAEYLRKRRMSEQPS